MGVKENVSKGDLDKNDYSRDKGGEIDLEKEKDKYLGGDNDILEGFYGSDEEIDFENFKKKKGAK